MGYNDQMKAVEEDAKYVAMRAQAERHKSMLGRDAGEPTRQTQLGMAQESLNACTDSLHETVAQLEARLKWAIRTDEEYAENGKDVEPAGMVPIANAVNHSALEVRRAIGRIESILSRLEI